MPFRKNLGFTVPPDQGHRRAATTSASIARTAATLARRQETPSWIRPCGPTEWMGGAHMQEARSDDRAPRGSIRRGVGSVGPTPATGDQVVADEARRSVVAGCDIAVADAV